ncbi:MAG TPA: hypothetical protein VK436_05050 [Methanocella sp.]|nr:hypothetical protein [Methanocella sp.]
MRKISYAVLVVSLILMAGAAVAQQFGGSQFGGSQVPGAGMGQTGMGQVPGTGLGRMPSAGAGQAQVPGAGAGTPTLNIPPAPPKPVPNSTYGNNPRAAILGEQFTKSSQGNAMVYIAENPNKTVSISVRMLSDGDPYSLAGTMANLTYMVDNVYSLTDVAGSDIYLTVYDPDGKTMTTAKFSDEKNAFEYYQVPEGYTPKQTPGRQPSFGQPSAGQPSFSQPSAGQPSFGQPSYQRPSFGGGPQGR